MAPISLQLKLRMIPNKVVHSTGQFWQGISPSNFHRVSKDFEKGIYYDSRIKNLKVVLKINGDLTRTSYSRLRVTDSGTQLSKGLLRRISPPDILS